MLCQICGFIHTLEIGNLKGEGVDQQTLIFQCICRQGDVIINYFIELRSQT